MKRGRTPGVVDSVTKARYRTVFTFILLLGLSMTASAESDEKGMIGRVFIDGFPVIYKLVDELPTDETRAKYPWLTVVAWPYDYSEKNGMPSDGMLEQMTRLERRLENLVDEGFSVHAYSRTGKNLKELVYYIHDQNEFMAELNNTLRGDTRYPISIKFYEDQPWEDFKKLLSSFRSASESQ